MKYCKTNRQRQKMRRRTKIRTNNSNGGKRALKGDEEKIHVLIYQPFPLSFSCPLFLSLPVSICLSAISHNQNYLLSLASNSAALSPSLFSRRSPSIRLAESLSVSASAWFPLHFVYRRWKQSGLVFFVFYSSLWRQTISKEYMNISSPGTRAESSIRTRAGKKCGCF